MKKTVTPRGRGGQAQAKPDAPPPEDATPVRIIVTKGIVAVVIILALSLIAAFLLKTLPEFTAFAAVVGPIFSGLAFGLAGFVTGQKLRADK